MVVQAGSGKNVKIDQKTEQNYNHAVDNSMLFKECVMQFLHWNARFIPQFKYLEWKSGDLFYLLVLALF